MSDPALILLAPSCVRTMRYFSYDVGKYCFRSLVTQIIAPDHPPAELGRLHTTPDALRYAKGRKLARQGGRMCWNKRWRTLSAHPMFRRALGEFIADVVSPLLYNGVPGPVVYQKEPTLRVHLPGLGPLGGRHIDYVYKRQPTEVNVWIPLSQVGPLNTLWTETAPGKADFVPVEADYGSALLFWGNQCRHGSCANSADITRVSLDVRVIREDFFQEFYVHPSRRSVSPNLLRGQHYTDTIVEARWRKGAVVKDPQEEEETEEEEESVGLSLFDDDEEEENLTFLEGQQELKHPAIQTAGESKAEPVAHVSPQKLLSFSNLFALGGVLVALCGSIYLSQVRQSDS